ncbi:MAG: hypothetical protein MPJ50_08150 [Pirellulales bacterium]|nr:hypothetical protein [Pirellulales bacterium]
MNDLSQKSHRARSTSLLEHAMAAASCCYILFVTLLLPVLERALVDRWWPYIVSSLVAVVGVGLIVVRKRALLCVMIPFWLWTAYVIWRMYQLHR